MAEEGHDWVHLPHVEGHFCAASWCRRCGTAREGPLGGEAEGGVPLYGLYYVPHQELPERWSGSEEPPCGWSRAKLRQPDQICGRCATPMTRSDGDPAMERYPIRTPGGASFLICHRCAQSFDAWLGTWAHESKETSR